jgi:hypothetical protein
MRIYEINDEMDDTNDYDHFLIIDYEVVYNTASYISSEYIDQAYKKPSRKPQSDKHFEDAEKFEKPYARYCYRIMMVLRDYFCKKHLTAIKASV